LGFKKHTLENGNYIYYDDFQSIGGVRFRLYWWLHECWYHVSLNIKPDVTEWYPVLVPRIESVHTLQNLYFALTGQELTIKS
jgi:hypothetical protein